MSRQILRAICFAFVCIPAILVAATRPNIVLIYTDDLGYGDVSCYGATNVSTPNIDKLANDGLRFTDAHATSATCTPSRYSMLTGEYAWRKKGTGVLPGDAKLIIDPGRPTLASILKNAGYATAAVGKWHLGLGAGTNATDWNEEVKPGPNELGFQYSYIMPATGDRVPCVFMENHRVVGLESQDPLLVSYGTNKFGQEPTGRENPGLLKMKPSHGHDFTIVNSISRIGYSSGGKSAQWKDEDIADVLTRRAVSFIEQNKARAFFLYFSTHDIHVPRVAHSRFAGKTKMGPRGDVIVQLDWCVGEVMAALKKNNVDANTLVIFTSDNGSVVDDGYRDDAVEKLGGHKPAGPWRGGKYSKFEGGTRVPFIVRWPNRVKRGISGALVSQIDLIASFATLLGEKIPANSAPDSTNTLAALLGESKTGREVLVEHAGGLALRLGNWKFIPATKGPAFTKNTSTETGNAPEPQLYDLSADPGEKKNVAIEYPERVKEMRALLQKIRGNAEE
jgi:arylsulfatase A-like enzyme